MRFRPSIVFFCIALVILVVGGIEVAFAHPSPSPGFRWVALALGLAFFIAGEVADRFGGKE